MENWVYAICDYLDYRLDLSKDLIVKTNLFPNDVKMMWDASRTVAQCDWIVATLPW